MYQRVGRLGWHRCAIYAILKQKPYNFTTNTQKAYLSAQASSLSAFVISKTHISGQKPRGRRINTKVCVSKSAIFVILSFLLRLLFKQRYLTNCLSTHRHFSTKLILITTQSSTNNQRLHSFNFTLVKKSHSQHCGCCPLRRTPFSNVVCMRTCSLVPMPNTTIIGLGTRRVTREIAS